VGEAGGWLKSAPIPVTRYTLAKAFGHTLILRLKHAPESRSASAVNRGRCGRLGNLLVAVRGLAIRAAAARKLPGAVIGPTVLAGAAPRAFWVVVCILVERDDVHGV
jgi:hypothetical protein